MRDEFVVCCENFDVWKRLQPTCFLTLHVRCEMCAACWGLFHVFSALMLLNHVCIILLFSDIHLFIYFDLSPMPQESSKPRTYDHANSWALKWSHSKIEHGKVYMFYPRLHTKLSTSIAKFRGVTNSGVRCMFRKCVPRECWKKSKLFGYYRLYNKFSNFHLQARCKTPPRMHLNTCPNCLEGVN